MQVHKKKCTVCGNLFDVSELQGRRKCCSETCRKLHRRKYMRNYMPTYRKHSHNTGKPEPAGASVENFSNLSITSEGRVAAAVQLEQAMKRCKT